MTEQYLFVYGTLKRGFDLHDVLRGQTFCSVVASLTRGRLFDCGNWPALVACDDGQFVRGELYRVSDACLQRCDDVEDVGTGLYERRLIDLCTSGPLSSPVRQAWCYFYLQSTEGLRDCGPEWTG